MWRLPPRQPSPLRPEGSEGLRKHLVIGEVLRWFSYQIPLFPFRNAMLGVPLPPQFLCSRYEMSQVWTQLASADHQEAQGCILLLICKF